jgi:hypothetical protein
MNPGSDDGCYTYTLFKCSSLLVQYLSLLKSVVFLKPNDDDRVICRTSQPSEV